MTELVFIRQPNILCTWIIHPFLLIGDPSELYAPENLGPLIRVSLEDTDFRRMEDLAEKVHDVALLIRAQRKVYLYDSGDYRRVKMFLLCFIQRWFNWRLNESTQYVNSCLTFLSKIPQLTEEQEKFVHLYKRPLTVLICGDRDSSVCFEEMINFELKMLPKYSTIIHGGCKGVDLYAAELARNQGFETKEYPAKWSMFGNAAGPKRNQEMLDCERVDMVLAFHPDISLSKGTKNMMFLAHRDGIPVYIHDLKRKMKFEGDFDVL
jgi:hypothetical protein